MLVKGATGSISQWNLNHNTIFLQKSKYVVLKKNVIVMSYLNVVWINAILNEESEY